MLKGYRTIIFNVIMTALMILKMWQPETEIPGGEEISTGLDMVDAAIAFVWGIGNLIFRAITDTSIGESK